MEMKNSPGAYYIVFGRPFVKRFANAVGPLSVCLCVTVSVCLVTLVNCGHFCVLKTAAHVYYDQTAGWIRIPLATEVGLGPGDIVLLFVVDMLVYLMHVWQFCLFFHYW